MWNCFPAGRACTCCFKASLSSHSLRLELTQDVEGWDSNVHCYLMWLPQLVSSCKRQIASALTMEFSPPVLSGNALRKAGLFAPTTACLQQFLLCLQGAEGIPAEWHKQGIYLPVSLRNVFPFHTWCHRMGQRLSLSSFWDLHCHFYPIPCWIQPLGERCALKKGSTHFWPE